MTAIELVMSPKTLAAVSKPDMIPDSVVDDRLSLCSKRGLTVVLIKEYADAGKAVASAPQARLQDAGDSS